MVNVSLIVPAYNVEQYIERCLDSLINQTFKNIEIIVINDGSTDSTLDRIKVVAQKDNRIRIINSKNRGVIEARKLGFNNSNGEYILFIDADDWIEKNTIESIYNRAIVGRYDIVCYKFKFVYDSGEIIKKNQINFDSLTGDDFLKIILLDKIYPSLVNKLIRKKFIIENKLEFPEDISYAEDLAFISYIAMKKPTVCMLDEYLYNYFQRKTSITKTISNKLLDVTEATKFIRQKLCENNLIYKYKDEFEILAYIHNYNNFKKIMITENSEITKKLYYQWKSLNINIYSNKYYKNLTKDEHWKTKLLFKIFDYNYRLGKLYTHIRYK